MAEVRIEKLQKLDQETLERLIEIYMSAYEGMREYGGEGESYAKRYLRWCWSKAKDGFFVAKIGDEIVGFIVCDNDWYSKYEGETVGAIHEFAVDKSYQGHGIGRKLMERCLQYLKGKKIELWVGEKNERAKAFYHEYGFRAVGKHGIWVRMIRPAENVIKGDEK